MKTYFTITGTKHYYGQDFFEKGMKVRLEKEPDNKVDREAIKVLMDGIGHIGYVANSPYTVIGESCSAGRLYDRIGDKAKGKVVLVMEKGVLCVLVHTKDSSADNTDEEIIAPETDADVKPVYCPHEQNADFPHHEQSEES